MRKSELDDLDVRDIDFERRLIHIREGKGGKERMIPSSGELLGHPKHLLGNCKKEPVYTNSRGDKLTVRQINNIVARAGEQAGIQNSNPK